MSRRYFDAQEGLPSLNKHSTKCHVEFKNTSFDNWHIKLQQNLLVCDGVHISCGGKVNLLADDGHFRKYIML